MTDYSAIPALNWSSLKNLIPPGSPRLYQHRLNQPVEDSDAMRLGRAVHCAVFEPDEFVIRYVIWNQGRRYGKDWDAFVAANRGATILTVEQYQTAIRIRDAVRGHREFRPEGMAEVALEWTDERTGLRLKGRADWIASGVVVLDDLKTTSTGIDARRFARTAFGYAYHAQLAHYRRGAAAAGFMPKDAPCRLIAVESAPPHDVAIWTLTEDDLWRGEQLVDWCLDRVVECQASGVWPGAHEGAGVLAAPGWYEQPNEDGGEAAAQWLMEG